MLVALTGHAETDPPAALNPTPEEARQMWHTWLRVRDPLKLHVPRNALPAVFTLASPKLEMLLLYPDSYGDEELAGLGRFTMLKDLSIVGDRSSSCCLNCST